MGEDRQLTEHQQTVEMLMREIKDGCYKAEILEDLINRSSNLTLKFRRQPTNAFCFAVIDLDNENRPRQTWLFDLSDFPAVFAHFKERGIIDSVFKEVVLLALDTLKKIRSDIQATTPILDIIHEAENGITK